MENKFEYNGIHMMVDAEVVEGVDLKDPTFGVNCLEEIAHAVNMTMILPPVTVKFPHAVCELTKTLSDLESEGLGNSKTANRIRADLKLRKEEAFGYSTFLMIAESHISIHTFPELNFYTFDCYSCKYFESDVVQTILNRNFPTLRADVQVHERQVPAQLKYDIYE